MATATSHVRFSSRVDLDEDVKSKIIDLCNARLADTIDFFTQVKHAHWNVKGPQFFQLHELFDDIAERAEGFADLIAERVTQLGGVAHGTARQVAKKSSIDEYEVEAFSGEDHVSALSHRLAQIANASRAAIDQADKLGDKATADLFTEVVRGADKDLWFLEAHLQG
jgi:starvation-inducible DNA-binding protein